MLGLKAKAGLLFFVSAGIFTGVVVFGNTVARDKIHSVAEKEAPEVAVRKPDQLQNAIGEPMPIMEETPLASLSGLRGTGAETAPAQASAGVNLTANLASLIGKNIVDKNPEGPAGDSLAVMGVEGMADAAVAESMKSFNPAYFSPEIPQDGITVDDAQTAAAYRAAAAKIINDADSQPPPPVSDPVASQMKTFAKRYETAATALYALPVPYPLIAEHLQAISRAVGKQRIFEAIADYENDPIYGMLALKLWETLR